MRNPQLMEISIRGRIPFRQKGLTVTNGNEVKAGITVNGNVDRMVVEWPDLKEFIRDATKGNFRISNLNRFRLDQKVNHFDEYSRGFSRGQAIDWLENGFQSEGLKNIPDFSPPIREKRRFIYSDEGDEIDLSAAWSGEDNFMTQWTKRESIPGVKLVFGMHFRADVRAGVIAEYIRWLAKSVVAVQSAGIDPEISIHMSHMETWNRKRFAEIEVRVKRQNEITDFSDWSAMLSPAGYRWFGFAAKILHADKFRNSISDAIGHMDDRWNAWKVNFDSEDGAIHVMTPNTPNYFPEEDMTLKLRNAIEALKANISTI